MAAGEPSGERAEGSMPALVPAPGCSVWSGGGSTRMQGGGGGTGGVLEGDTRSTGFWQVRLRASWPADHFRAVRCTLGGPCAMGSLTGSLVCTV